jgi:subtilisin
LSYKGGYDFVNNDSDPMDTDVDYHGTRAAGIIVAQFDGKEVVGVATPIFRFLLQIDEIVNLYVAKIAERSTGGLKSTSEKGLQWCIEKNPQIIYMNYGSFQFSLTERDLIQKANEKGILLIAASGNNGINDIWYPSKHDEVIAVGSIDKKILNQVFQIMEIN